ncbi:MAG: TRAP transporter small permease [Gammaproteobacteria bacterium]|nr:TRAP transporter small permease [Gammaproteobacteria bacterium]MDE0489226.1 TRAP transporter small permease [Gammaproteobacteria bacterium]
MRRLEQQLDRAAGKIADFVLKVAAAGLVAMTLVIAWQVFARYVLNASPPWSEAAALIVMVSFVLLAAAVGVYEKFHLGFRWLVTRLPIQSRRAAFVLGQVLILAFGAAMAFNGMALVDYTATHIIPTLGIARSVAYWPFVACGGLMALFACVNCVNVFLGRRDADPWN